MPLSVFFSIHSDFNLSSVRNLAFVVDPEPAKYRFGPESLDSYLNILELAEQIVGVDRKNGVQADLLAGLQYSF